MKYTICSLDYHLDSHSACGVAGEVSTIQFALLPKYPILVGDVLAIVLLACPDELLSPLLFCAYTNCILWLLSSKLSLAQYLVRENHVFLS